MKHASSPKSSGLLRGLRVVRQLVFGQIRLGRNGSLNITFGEPRRLPVAARMARTRIAVAAQGPERHHDSRPSDLGMQDRTEVTEVRISEFDAAVEYELTRPAILR